MIPSIHAAKYGEDVRQPVSVRQDTELLESNQSNVTNAESNSPKVVKSGFNKVAYQREYMRKRRLKEKEAHP